MDAEIDAMIAKTEWIDEKEQNVKCADLHDLRDWDSMPEVALLSIGWKAVRGSPDLSS